jgi:F-type H+-transporting ATPase subunit delta
MNHSGEPHTLQEGKDLREAFDVGAQRIARVYATALLNAAGPDRADEMLEDLQSFIRDVFPADLQLEDFLCGAAIGRDRKAAVLRTAFEGRASELFLNFMLVLNDQERLDLLRPILAAASDLNDQRKGRKRVLVRSAVPLADDQRERLKAEVRDSFHCEPVLQMKVDPDLLGGLVVQVGDWVFDGSVRSQVETIRNQLVERSSYEIQSERNRFCAD